jgi:hypothetical protein
MSCIQSEERKMAYDLDVAFREMDVFHKIYTQYVALTRKVHNGGSLTTDEQDWYDFACVRLDEYIGKMEVE